MQEQGYDLSLIQKYDHLYPDKRGKQQANAYPNAWLGAFRSWFRGVYLAELYPSYLVKHISTMLPARTAEQREDKTA